jgi:hypothetical protein
MFDALDRVVLPQVPQRDKNVEHIDPVVPLLGMVTGMSLGFATRHALSPKGLLAVGLVTWAGAYGVTRLSFGEPHDYFGRENAPSSVAYGALAVVSSFGSSWAIHGAWNLITSRR